jgi:hypothetical protein
VETAADSAKHEAKGFGARLWGKGQVRLNNQPFDIWRVWLSDTKCVPWVWVSDSSKAVSPLMPSLGCCGSALLTCHSGHMHTLSRPALTQIIVIIILRCDIQCYPSNEHR